MLEDFDKNVSTLSESLARVIDRRKMLGTTVKGLSAVVVAAALGQFTNLGRAFANNCYCECDDCWSTGQPCGNIGFTCPVDLSAKCPSSCSICIAYDCGGWCDYNNGSWIAYECYNLGSCQKGYKLCTDCKCPDCNHKCTCLSTCICCSCCTVQDVRAEMRRIDALSH